METDLIVAAGAILALILCNLIAELRAIDAMTTRTDQPAGASVAPNAEPAVRRGSAGRFGSDRPGSDDGVVHLAPTL